MAGRAVVIGGKGKVGTYLVPALVSLGYEVTNVSRGNRQAYLEDGRWEAVRQVNLDRSDGAFAEKIAALKPDVVLDMICFTQVDMKRLMDALRGQVSHYLVTGSVWAHGASEVVPYAEAECRKPFGTYGIEKDAMARLAAQEYARTGFPATVVHPGHIVGPGHLPINPQGNQNPQVFSDLMHGRPVELPNLGMETLHHVHAADVAGVFLAALTHGSVSFGQDFHAVSPGAVTLRGYAQEAASWFGQQAKLEFLPVEQWKARRSEADANLTLDHILHSPNASMEKAKRLLGFTPRYTSYQAVREALQWMLDHGMVQ